MSLPGQDTRVVELRVPGLVGVSGPRLLDTIAVVNVAGDENASVVRPSDRLRRPAPGPVLQVLRRSLPRTLEGYLWYKMTSGGALKAVWALLFPFSLANVAHGMIPAVPEGSRGAWLLAGGLRAALRVVGLLLTALFITQLGVISLDLIAAQCLADGAASATCFGVAPAALHDRELVRVAIGLAPLLALIAILHRVSVMQWTGPDQRNSASRDEDSSLPGHSLLSSPNARVLRGLHTLVALACVALLPLGGPFAPPEGTVGVTIWSAAVVLLACTLLAAAVLDDGLRWPRTVWSPRVMAALITLAVLLTLGAAATHLPLDPAGSAGGRITGINSMVEGIAAALLASCVVFAGLLLPFTLLARSTWRTLPHRLRPWLGGWAAAPTLILACLTGAGFGAGLAIAVREIIADRTFPLPASYTALTLLWGAGTAIAVVLGLLTYGVAIPLRRRIRGTPSIVHMLHDDSEQRTKAAGAWASAIIERKHMHRLVAAVVLLMTAGALGLGTLRLAGIQRPGWLEPLSGFGVLALGILAAGLLRVVYTAARTPERDRHLGALADLVYFWPRKAHPVVPPSYALKVVPDLAHRARRHLEEPETRVVISGYSHGGLLAVLATAELMDSLDEAERTRVGLLTAGSPLQWGYQRAFPALLSHASLANLYGALRGRWRGLCRGTDPFGGGATTWRHQVVDKQLLGVGYLPDGGTGPLPAAEFSPTGALVLGGDHWLPDPVPHTTDIRRWAAGVLRHSDYLVDEEWDRAVAMAAGLQRPGSSGPNGEQVSLFGDLPVFGRRTGDPAT